MKTRDSLRYFVVFPEGIAIHYVGRAADGIRYLRGGAISVLITVQMYKTVRLGGPRRRQRRGYRKTSRGLCIIAPEAAPTPIRPRNLRRDRIMLILPVRCQLLRIWRKSAPQGRTVHGSAAFGTDTHLRSESKFSAVGKPG